MLKQYATIYTSLHNNLTKEEKTCIYDFIKNSSDEQVMSLLLTGECKEKLQEGEGKFVRELFNMSPVGIIFDENFVNEGRGLEKVIHQLANKWATYKEPNVRRTLGAFLGDDFLQQSINQRWAKQYELALKTIKTGAPIAATALAALIILVSYKVYKLYLSKAARACSNQGTKELKKKCIKKYKIEALKAQIKDLTSAKTGCKETKNPQKCAAKVDQKINSIKLKLQKEAGK